MTSDDIRNTFLDFFRSRGHEIVRSSSLIPGNDPSLLFTNAGMVQFKSVFLGEDIRPYKRAASSQKCVRAGGKHNDLENVGYTARHHTFFEMLGNFSFGDYFKHDAILFAWELLTEKYKLPREKLWVTVFEEDDEAAQLWEDLTDISPQKIVRLGAKDNFWQMGDTGPCGPCSEIIMDQGSEIGCNRPDCAVGCDCDRYLEIWNLVFMQYDRDKSGTLIPLPKPSIDTGMGLERLSSVIQGKHNNFDTDIFSQIIPAICSYSKKSYGIDKKTDTAIRVIADHIRSISFLLSEGLVPSNEGRGYVLRRIIRRASRYSKSLDIDEPVLFKLADTVAGSMGSVYPELLEEKSRVQKILQLEEERFNKTLEQGLIMLNGIIADMRKTGDKIIPGDELFRLYDTYGFPLDIAKDVAGEHDLQIDEPGFHKEMQLQKTKARASWSVEEVAVAPVYRELFQQYSKTVFVGYYTLEAEATALAIIKDGEIALELPQGSTGEVLLDRTPFYAEAGGQAGDNGEFIADNLKVVVTDTKKPVEGMHIHKISIKTGTLKTGSKIFCSVDPGNRTATMRNHTTTHLLHAALRNLLGEHVKQAGSYVEPESLRFDFTHFDSLGRETIEDIEDEVNDAILRNIQVHTTVMDTKKAIESGVTALFSEKYGDTVRVVKVGDVSAELCGGTHVNATGDIGIFKILSEGSVASGIRRIEAVTGKEAIKAFRSEENELGKISEILKTSENPSEKVKKLLFDIKKLEKSLEKFKGRSASESSTKILETARDINGVKVISHRIDGLDAKDLRELADKVRDGLGSGILLLASVKDDQAAMVAMATKDLLGQYKAGDLLRQVAAAAGGRGGGKPDIAQGGTKEINKLDKAISSLYEIIKRT
ncbi:MAG: alanine--tRNA ligase [Nitrospira bacterium HGW-Nitrospira-1]|nr:MAG: alanine--tRNA ligase [Nitrospira bacterium HGW-Nitrospira-1]